MARLFPRDRMLEDALRAGVVEELSAGDQSFAHRHLAPGAEPIGQRRLGGSRGLGLLSRRL